MSYKSGFSLFLIICLIIYTISPNNVNALETIQSAWPTNTFSVESRQPNLADWTDARKIDEMLEYNTSFHYFRLYVKNDFSYIWLGIIVKNISSTNAQMSICIDANNDGQWPEDLKRIHTLSGKNDRFWPYNSPSDIIDPLGVDFWGNWKKITSSLPGGDVDSYFFVYQIPLISDEKRSDLQIPEPEGTTIGVGLAYLEGNQDSEYWPSRDSIYDAANYSKLTLAGPGAVAPPDYEEQPPAGQTTTETETETVTGTETTGTQQQIISEAGGAGAPGFSFLMVIGCVLLFSLYVQIKRKE